MPTLIQRYDLLISCPGDITSEIDIIKKVVQRFNSISDVQVRDRYWVKDAFPETGGDPQTLLNNQFIDECDMAVAIFWTRFGTGGDTYKSGTEAEIKNMIQQKKQVFLYFSDKPARPSTINSDQYKKIKVFQDEFKQSGLYFGYKTDEDFENLFYDHLSTYFKKIEIEKPKTVDIPILNNGSKNKPHLKIQSIYNEQLHNIGYVEKFDLNGRSGSNKILSSIKTLFKKINESNVTSPSRILNANVTITSATQNCIKTLADEIGITLSNHFFGLGNLKTDHDKFEGSKEARQKHGHILQLEKHIIDFRNFTSFEKTFENLSCIKFVLSNDGTAYDEDIQIELEVKNEILICPEQFNIPSEHLLEYISNDPSNLLDDLFTIQPSKLYGNYEFGDKSRPELAGNKGDYEDIYKKKLSNTFINYRFFP